MKLGVYSKIRSADYHSGHGVSSSDIKQLLRSTLHFEAYKKSKDDPSAAMIKGSLVHCLILEPEQFDTEYAVGDFNIRRGKEYDKTVSDNPGKSVISRAEMEEASLMVEAFFIELNKNPELKALADGLKEYSIYWEDPTTGILCKARPDIITPQGDIVDLKTSSDASFDAFQKGIVDMQYFVSAAYYLRSVRAARLLGADLPEPRDFYFIVVENKAPYAIAIYKLSPQAIQMGEYLIDCALNSYAEAVSTMEMKGYSRKPIEIGLPGYAYYKQNYLGYGGEK